MATITLAPLLRPSSAVAPSVTVRNSSTLSGFNRWIFPWGLGTVDSLASMPSIVTLWARSRDPKTCVPDPAPLVVRCTTPGSSVSNASGLRPFRGRSCTCFVSMTSLTVAFEVSRR